jgi:predicted ferric reductase
MITWAVLRAAGIGAYLMLFASVAWGLVGTTATARRFVAKPTAIAVHQFMATVAVVLMAVHIGGLVIDGFMPFGVLDVLIPLHGSFRPVAVALGILAMDASVIVLVSSWARKPIGTTWWRRLHLLAVPAFVMSLVHGAFAGTDTARVWTWWLYVITGGLVLFLVLARGLTSGIRAARATPHSAHARTPRPGMPAAAPRSAGPVGLDRAAHRPPPPGHPRPARDVGATAP